GCLVRPRAADVNSRRDLRFRVHLLNLPTFAILTAARMTQLQLPPTLRDSSPVANGLALRRDPLGFFARLAREAGDFAHYRLNDGVYYFVNDPELVREVLVALDANFTKWVAAKGIRVNFGEGLLGSKGEAHDHIRRLVRPAFQQSRLPRYAQQIIEVADRQL